MKAPGCGWEPDEPGDPVEPDADMPCVARDGCRGPYGSNATVGMMGLCLSCLANPGKLLHELSKSVLGAPDG